MPTIAFRPKAVDEKLSALKSFSEYVSAYEVRKLLRVLVTTKLSKYTADTSEAKNTRPKANTIEVLLGQGCKRISANINYITKCVD